MIAPHSSGSSYPAASPDSTLARQQRSDPLRWERTWGSSRLLVASLSAGIVLYSTVVILTVALSGDPGLRCVFGRIIKDVDDGRAWRTRESASIASVRPIPPNYVWSDGPPERGSILEMVVTRDPTAPGRLDSHVIEHYTDYVKALRAIGGRLGQPIEVRWRSADGIEKRAGETIVRRPPARSYVWSLVWFLQEMMIFAVVARAFWARPHDASARLFFWLCVLTVGAFMGGYHWSQIVIYRPLIFLFAAFAVYLPVVSLHFYLIFPRPNPILVRHRRLVLTVLYAIPTVSLIGLWCSMVFTTLVRDTGGRELENSLYVLQSLALGYVCLAVVFFVLCLACLAYSYRRATDRVERNQVKWILLATLAAVLPISYLLWDVWRDPARLGLARSGWPMFVVSLLYTLAYAMSITRYKLMKAEELFGRGLVYFLVSLAAGLLYSGMLVVSALVIGDKLLTHSTSTGAIVAGCTAVVLLVLSEAGRQRFQKVIDRRFYREKYKLDQAMRKMSHAVGSLVDRGTLGRRLLEAADEVLRIEWGALYLAERESGPLTLVACHGPDPDERVLAADNVLVQRMRRDPTIRVSHSMGMVASSDPATDAVLALGGEVAAALAADGALAGVLIVGPKRNGMPYEDEEIAFLGGLSSVATLALHSADIQHTLEGLNKELRFKVDKIAEQQRRILILQDQLVGRANDAGAIATAPVGLPATEPTSEAMSAIKGTSKAVRRMLEMARKVAASPSAVLIRGESGTGKELLAEAIHAQSPRSNGPFVKVHCAALSQNLLESELFGHVRGAFTGADRDRTGRFQQADGGTLFLDEIGDIHWEVQTKLLRVLQEMTFERVGSSTPMTVDVRIVAATHQDLEGLIRAGKFREDLYYRLNVIPIRTPALRERKEDIFELAVHFLGYHARKMDKPVTRLDDSAIESLIAHDWPGNIRELENVIERAVVLSDGSSFTIDDLPIEPRRSGNRRRTRVFAAASSPASVARSSDRPPGPSEWEIARAATSSDALDLLDLETEAYERRRLTDALAEAGGVKSEAARLLAMPRSTFFSKLRKHGLI
jgi:transcriptional regulator with GAF, ATPase, and Fis domain